VTQAVRFSIDDGYAERTVADRQPLLLSPECYSSVEAVPLLRAGLNGYRTLGMAGDAQRVGIYGFGAAGAAPETLGLRIHTLGAMRAPSSWRCASTPAGPAAATSPRLRNSMPR
jgi:hypothetical protein